MWPESTTVKICLNSLPSKTPEPGEEFPTPPVQTPVSIPFNWEEAPGKPRRDDSSKPKPKAVRSLELPPAKKISSDSPSPTSILEGTESGKGVTHTLSFSFGKLSFRSPEGAGHINGSSHRWNLSSWRWRGSFRRNNEVADGGNMDFFVDSEPEATSPFEKKKKMSFSTKKRSDSFFNFSKRPNFFADIYKSFKQAVPWRRKQGSGGGSRKQMA